jgi:GNAT superfamily N-acetyltransferase
MYKYIKTSLEENKEFFNSYVDSLSGIYDDFLEYHILNSEIYSIYIDKLHCGYFGIFNKTMLTQFFITKKFLKLSQEIFADILKCHKIKNAFVPTCDELFLSLCLDKHTKLNLQAYFFQVSGEKAVPPEYPRECLKLAALEDIEEIKEVTGDFVDKHQERINQRQLYILREGSEFLGLGIITDNEIMKNCKGTGMFTNERHRQKGVGRSIIIHLKDICHEMGAKPIPGCWYYNHNSKKTLESAGFASTTRLLRIDFTDNAE